MLFSLVPVNICSSVYLTLLPTLSLSELQNGHFFHSEIHLVYHGFTKREKMHHLQILFPQHE